MLSCFLKGLASHWCSFLENDKHKTHWKEYMIWIGWKAFYFNIRVNLTNSKMEQFRYSELSHDLKAVRTWLYIMGRLGRNKLENTKLVALSIYFSQGTVFSSYLILLVALSNLLVSFRGVIYSYWFVNHVEVVTQAQKATLREGRATPVMEMALSYMTVWISWERVEVKNRRWRLGLDSDRDLFET